MTLVCGLGMLPVLLQAPGPFGGPACPATLVLMRLAWHRSPGAIDFQSSMLAYQVLNIILGLHQPTLLFGLSQSFISLLHLLLTMFVPGTSWSSHLFLTAEFAGGSSPILQ